MSEPEISLYTRVLKKILLDLETIEAKSRENPQIPFGMEKVRKSTAANRPEGFEPKKGVDPR